jgi:hypothetical protein
MADPIPLSVWLDANWQDAIASTEGEKEGSRPRTTKSHASSELVKKHPFLKKHFRDKEKVQTDEGDENELVSEDEIAVEPEDEDFVAMALAQLEARRSKWEEDGHISVDAVEVIIRGGSWLAKHKHVAFDEFRAQPRTSEARSFCRLYGWHLSFSASIARYGESVASQLCLAWAHKAQHFYQLWCEGGDDSYDFSEADVKGYTEPLSYLELAIGMDIASPAFSRVCEIRAMVPRKPATQHG